MYWLVLAVLLLFAFCEITKGKISRLNFHIAYLLLTLLVVLRQGQGTDYYNYREMYEAVDEVTSIVGLTLIYHGEIGFLFLNYVAAKLGCSYQLFSALFSLLTMGIFYPFFSDRCRCSIIPILFFYSTFFLLYPFSAIRQGLTLGIMVSYLFPLLEQRDWSKYILVTILAATIHVSVLICLCFPFIYRIRITNTSLFLIFIILCLLITLNIDILRFFPLFTYTGRTNNFYLAAGVRICMLLPIFLISDKVYRDNSELLHVRNLLFFGFIIYAMFSSNDLTASRLGVYCRIFEGLFLSMLIYRTTLKKFPKQLLSYYAAIVLVLFGKSIGDFIEQGDYSNCNIITYPYLSIFDNPQRIMYYRGEY